MTGVFIAAAQNDKKMWKTFPSILCSALGAVCLRENQADFAENAIVIGNIADSDAFRPDHTMIIWKENVGLPARLAGNDRTVAIVNTDGDATILGPLSSAALPAITCGMSPRDTLTMSSFGSENTVITLQRSLTCFDGTVVEPQEIPITLKGALDSFTLMATAAVFFLTGNRKLLNKANFDVDVYNNSQSYNEFMRSY